MASILIRQLSEKDKERLRVRAAKRGRSMEAEAREILRTALVTPEPEENPYVAIRRLIEPLGGVELKIPKRTSRPQPAFD